jgi:hypothetical protein
VSQYSTGAAVPDSQPAGVPGESATLQEWQCYAVSMEECEVSQTLCRNSRVRSDM